MLNLQEEEIKLKPVIAFDCGKSSWKSCHVCDDILQLYCEIYCFLASGGT